MTVKTERLSLRLTPEQDLIIRRAAEVCGESTNEYVLRNAFGAAQTDLADLRTFVADDDAWDVMQTMLAEPVQFNAAMLRLLSTPSALER